MADHCETCRYYYQHYIRCGNRYEPLGYGHCTHPRLKWRLLTTPACAHYAQGRKSVRFPHV